MAQGGQVIGSRQDQQQLQQNAAKIAQESWRQLNQNMQQLLQVQQQRKDLQWEKDKKHMENLWDIAKAGIEKTPGSSPVIYFDANPQMWNALTGAFGIEKEQSKQMYTELKNTPLDPGSIKEYLDSMALQYMQTEGIKGGKTPNFSIDTLLAGAKPITISAGHEDIDKSIEPMDISTGLPSPSSTTKVTQAGLTGNEYAQGTGVFAKETTGAPAQKRFLSNPPRTAEDVAIAETGHELTIDD